VFESPVCKACSNFESGRAENVVDCLSDAGCKTKSSSVECRNSVSSPCSKEYENEQLLQRHVKYRHDAPKQWFKCNECDRGFRFQLELKKHSLVHGGVENMYRVVQKKRYPSFNFAITSVNVHRL